MARAVVARVFLVAVVARAFLVVVVARVFLVAVVARAFLVAVAVWLGQWLLEYSWWQWLYG